MPVSDIVKELNPSINIGTGKEGIYVSIDKNFVTLADGVENFSKNWACPSVDRMVSGGYLDIDGRSCEGPSALFCRTLLMASGIKDSTFYAGWEDIIYPLVFDIRIFPFDIIPLEINGKVCEFGLVQVENTFLINLIKCFTKKSHLTILTPSQDCNAPDPVKVTCLKTALQNLLKIHSNLNENDTNADANRNQIYSLEAWMQYFLDKYLESQGCYCDIRVASTYYGNVHKLGGMEPEVPYVVFGHLQRYDEDGWDDPRTSNAETVMQARNCLLGETSPEDWVKFTPQFGG
jgi:hypothetical protein